MLLFLFSFFFFFFNVVSLLFSFLAKSTFVPFVPFVFRYSFPILLFFHIFLFSSRELGTDKLVLF
jgi:hypothetical protein